MKRLNISTYAELSKIAENLSTAGSFTKIKRRLKTQAAYFNILGPKYPLEQLSQKLKDIVAFLKKGESQIIPDEKVVVNAIVYMIYWPSNGQGETFIHNK